MNNDAAFYDIILQTVEVLKRGGVILYPTDTVWGLGCDATNQLAVEKILRIKKRNSAKGLILLDADYMRVQEYNPTLVNDIFFTRAKQETCPFTIVYPTFDACASLVKAEDGSVAVRVVEHHFCRYLIRLLGQLIVSTSANISGQPSPKNYSTIDAIIKEQVDFIVPPLDAENANRSQASIIYKIENFPTSWKRLR